MAQQEPDGDGIPGCREPRFDNYNPFATIDDGSCRDNNTVVGCSDPLALNYFNPLATVGPTPFFIDCEVEIQQWGANYVLVNQGLWNNGTTCCYYSDSITPPPPPPPPLTATTTGPTIVVVPTVTATTCNGPYSLTTNNIVNNVNSVTCCNANTITNITLQQNQTYYWDGIHCYLRNNCPTSTCLNCNNFNNWNNLYIANHNGSSLQTTNGPTWAYLLNAITNSGDTFYYNTSNGNFLDEVCCITKNGTFLPQYGLCSCKAPAPEVYRPKCISSLSDVMDLISGTTSGSTFFNNNLQTIGPSLGLTNQQINFIIGNLTTNLDAKIILSNALTVTGGFHVNFGILTNTPKLMTNAVCTQYGGYWDSNNNCMCKPIVNQCKIDITQVEVVTTKDFYNSSVQVVKYNSQNGGTAIGEACCNRLVKDYNMPYVWQNQPTPFCYAKAKEVCLPAVFSLNDNKPMEVPACDTDLELSMWVYFGAPNKPCGPLPFPPDDGIIVIDGQFCDITLSGTTPNTGAIIPNLNGTITTPTTTTVVGQEVTTQKCCYNNSNPIIGQISLTDSTLNSSLIQSKTYNSSLDYFNKWVQIKAKLPSSGTTLNFNVNFEIIQGLNCCCDYDIFIDDIRVDCVKQVPSTIINDIQCPGFELTRVIDNKKSWVYNPGLPSVGISEYDEIERNDGSFGTLNGEGTINRTFAPSGDADIPWRYTDYFKQSSVYENHSKLVLNTKELDLTFDMCADCVSQTITTYECPSGFILSGGTNICYQEISQKIFQDGDDFIFMDGDDYIYQ